MQHNASLHLQGEGSPDANATNATASAAEGALSDWLYVPLAGAAGLEWARGLRVNPRQSICSGKWQ